MSAWHTLRTVQECSSTGSAPKLANYTQSSSRALQANPFLHGSVGNGVCLVGFFKFMGVKMTGLKTEGMQVRRIYTSNRRNNSSNSSGPHNVDT